MQLLLKSLLTINWIATLYKVFYFHSKGILWNTIYVIWSKEMRKIKRRTLSFYIAPMRLEAFNVEMCCQSLLLIYEMLLDTFNLMGGKGYPSGPQYRLLKHSYPTFTTSSYLFHLISFPFIYMTACLFPP